MSPTPTKPRTGPPTRSQAINGMCRSCTYDPHQPGTWRQQVAACSVIACPLWPVRPAPSSGPLSNPPRRPEDVTPEWRKAPLDALLHRSVDTKSIEPCSTATPDPSCAGG